MNKTTYEQQLIDYGTLTYTTVGRSMRPFLRSGEDLMVIKARQDIRFRKYDAVLYRRNTGKYVLHRIIQVREKDYVLSGDNIWRIESGIRDDQILGVLTTVIRNGKPVDVNSPGYKRIIRLWWALYPIRAIILMVRDFLFGLLRKLKRFSGQ